MLLLVRRAAGALGASIVGGRAPTAAAAAVVVGRAAPAARARGGGGTLGGLPAWLPLRGLAQARAPTASPWRAVLVRVGSGKYLEVDRADVTGMSSARLLKALKRDEGFKVELAAVPLSKCEVRVCASASKVAPSVDEVAGARPLEGAVSLVELAVELAAAGMAGSNLFVHVHLPPPAASATGSSARGCGELTQRESAAGSMAISQYGPAMRVRPRAAR